MKRFTLVSAALVLVVTSRATVQAQEMLVNGDLNQTHQLGSPALYYPELVGWTHTTNPNSNFPAPIVPYVPGQFYTQYAGYPAGFADRLNPGTTGQNGLTGTSFEGYYPFEIVGPVDLEISHTHAATPGELYRFSGWAHFEGGYAGGVEFLDLLSPNQRNQDAQATNPGVPVAALTDTIFALEFLDATSQVIPGSIVYELHDDGGQQNDNQLDGRTWP